MAMAMARPLVEQPLAQSDLQPCLADVLASLFKASENLRTRQDLQGQGPDVLRYLLPRCWL